MNPLVVGDPSDAHLIRVVDDARGRGVDPIILNADTLVNQDFSVSTSHVEIDGRPLPPHSRGWLRRIATSRWSTGETVGSVEDVAFRSRLKLVASLARTSPVHWLTHIDDLQRAEDKLYQLQTAARLGLRIPRTLVASDVSELVRDLGANCVVKPLGPGGFVEEGVPKLVFASALTAASEDADLRRDPFLAQECVRAAEHLRVVTCCETAVSAALNADDWPLDWREAPDAHSSWVACDRRSVEESALVLAGELGVRFSSQDWLVTSAGESVFLDLNPAGQWLFLPDGVAEPITTALVDFLAGAS